MKCLDNRKISIFFHTISIDLINQMIKRFKSITQAAHRYQSLTGRAFQLNRGPKQTAQYHLKPILQHTNYTVRPRNGAHDHSTREPNYIPRAHLQPDELPHRLRVLEGAFWIRCPVEGFVLRLQSATNNLCFGVHASISRAAALPHFEIGEAPIRHRSCTLGVHSIPCAARTEGRCAVPSCFGILDCHSDRLPI